MVLSIQMTDSNNYIVYEVRHNGVPIYIGSGKEGRDIDSSVCCGKLAININ